MKDGKYIIVLRDDGYFYYKIFSKERLSRIKLSEESVKHLTYIGEVCSDD